MATQCGCLHPPLLSSLSQFGGGSPGGVARGTRFVSPGKAPLWALDLLLSLSVLTAIPGLGVLETLI